MCMASRLAMWPWAKSERYDIDQRGNINSTEIEKNHINMIETYATNQRNR